MPYDILLKNDKVTENLEIKFPTPKPQYYSKKMSTVIEECMKDVDR